MQIIALEGAIGVLAGVETVMEVEVHMLEELEHQDPDKDNGLVGQH